MLLNIERDSATASLAQSKLAASRAKAPAGVVAVPVAPAALVEEIRRDVLDFICLEPLGTTGAVGAHYLSATLQQRCARTVGCCAEAYPIAKGNI